MSLQELKDTMVSSKGASRIAIGSVCHTDSAKAYKKLDSEEALPALYNGALGGPSFAHLKLAHSNVRHKPPHPEFTHRFKLKVWDGPTLGARDKNRRHPEARRFLRFLPQGGWQKVVHSFTSGCELSNFCIGSLSQTLLVFGEMRKLERVSVGSVT